jgi:hypothetical protein
VLLGCGLGVMQCQFGAAMTGDANPFSLLRNSSDLLHRSIAFRNFALQIHHFAFLQRYFPLNSHLGLQKTLIELTSILFSSNEN